MTKGYWIVRITVKDEAKYDAYRSLNGEAFHKYGGRFLVRGGKYDNPLGSARQRNVVIEFPTYQAALECYRSPEYQRAIAARGNGAEIDHITIEGYDGPQP